MVGTTESVKRCIVLKYAKLSLLLIRSQGKWKECNCLFIAETTFYSDRKHLWNERETILEKALEPKHKEHETNCDTKKVDVENTSFKEYELLEFHHGSWTWY
jgi:hypothetical protein